MIANNKFQQQPLEFWANVKLISQKVGYTERGTAKIKVPTKDQIVEVYRHLGLETKKDY